MKLGRNAPCHCGSGKKYKYCHYEADRKAAKPIVPDETEPDQSEVAADPDAETETDEHTREEVAPPAAHHKDRSRFQGQAQGRRSSFKPNTTRGSKRGS